MFQKSPSAHLNLFEAGKLQDRFEFEYFNDIGDLKVGEKYEHLSVKWLVALKRQSNDGGVEVENLQVKRD